jgi:hypothetical protein
MDGVLWVIRVEVNPKDGPAYQLEDVAVYSTRGATCSCQNADSHRLETHFICRGLRANNESVPGPLWDVQLVRHVLR